MTDRTVGVDVSGGQIQGIVGAGSVVIENLTFYSRAPEEPAQSAAAERIGPCPYPGLAYFGPYDADVFFGRDAAIARLAEAVGGRSFTALVGASGSGKSSVVLAGLAPRLHSAGNWRFSHFRIGTELESNPFLALARALAPLYVASDSDVERLKNTKLLATSLAAGDLTLRDVFADCRSRNKGRRILLIADQFEEAFTLVADEAVRSRFIDVLLAGFPDPPAGGVPDICLILTMRADFYGRALQHRPLADALQNHLENLGPMNRAELQAAIVQPAASAGVTFEPGLVETLLDTVESKPGGLPLLQFALREMWGRQERKRITRKSYDEIGGVEGALAQRAETVFAGLTRNGADAEMAKAFQRLFTRLVTLGEGQEDTRRVVERAELSDEVWGLAQRLAGEENRLVVTNASSARETAEVVHEALIRHWPKLVDWINRDRAFQSWLRQIRSNIELRSAHPDDDGPLLRGGMLAQARDWLARRRDDLSEKELAFIEASVSLSRRAEAEKEAARQAEIRRQQELAEAAVKLADEQRRRAKVAFRLGGAAGAAALIAIVLFFLALYAMKEAQYATEEARRASATAMQERARAEEQRGLALARQLATEARVVFNRGDSEPEDLQLSLLLATASLRFAWTQEGFEAWSDAINLSPPRPSTIPDAEHGPYAHVTFSPDGSLMAAAGKNVISLIDAKSLKPVATLPQAGARTLTFSPPDGRFLASGVGDKVIVWNVAERKLVKELSPDGERFLVESIAFDSTAKRLAFAGRNYYASIFETEGWSQIARDWSQASRGKHGSVHSVAFSPDDRWLLTNGTSLVAWELAAATDHQSGPDGSMNNIRSVALRGDGGRPPHYLAFSRNGDRLATSNDISFVPPAQDGAPFTLLDKVAFGRAAIAALSPDAGVAATSGFAVWRVLQSGTREAARILPDTTPEERPALAFAPSGKWLISAGNRLERWDVAAGGAFAQLQHDTEVLAVGVDPNSRYVATTAADGFAHVWDTNDWSKVRALEIHRPEGRWTASNIVFSSNGRWLAASSEKVLRIFSTDGWHEVARSEHKHKIERLGFSPDARWVIALGNDGSSYAVDVTATDSWRTTSIAVVAKHDLGAISVSPDGRWLSTKRNPYCSWRPTRVVPGIVRVWQMTNGERVASMPLGIEAMPEKDPCPGHNQRAEDPEELPSGQIELAKEAVSWKSIPIAAAGYKIESSDGRWSAKVDDSYSIKLQYEDSRAVTLPHFDKMYDMAFLPNGRWLVTTSADGTARVWALTHEDMVAASCARLKGNLSEEDWRKYLDHEPYVQVCPGLPTLQK